MEPEGYDHDRPNNPNSGYLEPQPNTIPCQTYETSFSQPQQKEKRQGENFKFSDAPSSPGGQYPAPGTQQQSEDDLSQLPPPRFYTGMTSTPRHKPDATKAPDMRMSAYVSSDKVGMIKPFLFSHRP